mgnify:CR=1 FL=1
MTTSMLTPIRFSRSPQSMPKETDQTRRDRKAKEARDRRRKKGLISCAGRGQGRKLKDLPDRPTCCDRLMLSNGLKWHCKICGASPRKEIKENDND